MPHHAPRARAGLLAIAVGVTTALTVLPAAADAEAARECLDAGNVWVVVQHGDDADGGCATEFATGLEALTSAGFVPDNSGGFIATIDGEPSDPGPEDWWSYWSLDPEDGGGDWVSYQVGAEEAEPQGGTVQGWRLWDSYATQAEAPTTHPLADDGTEAASTPAEAGDAAPAVQADDADPADDSMPAGTAIGLGALVVLAAGGVALWIRRRPRS